MHLSDGLVGSLQHWAESDKVLVLVFYFTARWGSRRQGCRKGIGRGAPQSNRWQHGHSEAEEALSNA